MSGQFGGRRLQAAIAGAALLLALGSGPALATSGAMVPAADEASGFAPITLRSGCAVPGDVVPAANRIMRDRYTLGTRPTVHLPHNPTWRENPFHDDNWQFDYQSLRFVLKLEAAYAQTGARRYLDRGLFLLRDWYRDNPRSAPRSRFSWNDHAAAWRAMVLACTAELVPMSTWLRRDLLLHGTALADPRFYVRHGNHALNQSIGLLEIGCLLGRSSWERLATQRIDTLVPESVDAQGVSNEQSIGYEYYDYRRFQAAEDRLRACGQPVPSTFDRIDRMPTFLGWATLPNGEYELIGDTHAGRTPAIPGTHAEFAATGGASGPRPSGTFATFMAGYAFGRSGWGETRPFADETAFAVRYGRGRAFHGHADGGSLTVYGLGSRLIVGSGTYSYNAGPFRRYFVGRSAQSVVTVAGVPYRDSATTPLLFRVETATALGVSVRVQGYAGVSDTRTVIYSRTGGYLLVDDRLRSARSRSYSQLWHLAPRSHPSVHGRAVETHTAGGDVVIQQLAGRPMISIVSGSTRPIQGWRTYRYNHKAAAPAVQARRTGKQVRFLTLIVPVRDATTIVRVVSVALRPNGYTAVISVGGRAERVVLNGSGVSITPLS